MMNYSNFVSKTILEVYRGNTLDLLDRHYQVAKIFDADAVVKIPSDCPLIDSKIIDKVILYYINNRDKYDFVSNLHPPSYPDGNDVEVMSFKALEKPGLMRKRISNVNILRPIFGKIRINSELGMWIGKQD